jgi:MFS family permease
MYAASMICSMRAFTRTSHHVGFWAVAYAYTVVMAFSAVPSPLYGLYEARDGFTTFTITVIFAVYAVGVVASLFLVGHISDWHGRRRVLVPAILLNMVSAVIFLVWPELPGLLVARLINGLAVGAVTATATAYLAELHAHQRPNASSRRSELVATAANLGGIGFGPLVAGLLSQYVSHPLTVPYVVLLVALGIAAVAVSLTPETADLPRPRPRYRPQRVSVPAHARGQFFAAALGALISFAANGLFTGLAGTFLAGSLHHPSRALAGASIFLVFASGVVAQALAWSWSVRRLLAWGMPAVLGGAVLLTVAAWMPSPSLVLFIAGGTLMGAGTGALFKGTLETVVAIASEDSRAEALAGLFLAAYIGLSIPVIGIGLAMQYVTTRVALLGFAAAIGVGIVAAAPTLLGGRGANTRALSHSV